MLLEAGAGHEGDLIRIGAQWELWERAFANDRWHLGVSLEADVGYWSPELGENDLWEIGATPVFQVASNRPSSRRLLPFLEAGLGAHLLSNIRFSDLYLSTSLQFGSHIGAGIYFGKDRRFSLVYRFQHLSNASVKQPNPGVEFHLLQFGFRVSRRR
jgi:lipid A 3-O-deacylase